MPSRFQAPFRYRGRLRVNSATCSLIAELRHGGGWGLAKAAELNGMPGPAHLLELRDEIPITREQVSAIGANPRAHAIGSHLGGRALHRSRTDARGRVSRRNGHRRELASDAGGHNAESMAASLHSPLRPSRDPGSADRRADRALPRPSRLPLQPRRDRSQGPRPEEALNRARRHEASSALRTEGSRSRGATGRRSRRGASNGECGKRRCLLAVVFGEVSL